MKPDSCFGNRVSGSQQETRCLFVPEVYRRKPAIILSLAKETFSATRYCATRVPNRSSRTPRQFPERSLTIRCRHLAISKPIRSRSAAGWFVGDIIPIRRPAHREHFPDLFPLVSGVTHAAARLAPMINHGPQVMGQAALRTSVDPSAGALRGPPAPGPILSRRSGRWSNSDSRPNRGCSPRRSSTRLPFG